MIGVEGIFLQCAVLHLQQHSWPRGGGGAAGIPFLTDEILFIMPLLHNKGAYKMHYIWESVTANRHKKAVIPTQPSISRNRSKLLCTIPTTATEVKNITTHHLNMTSVHESLTVRLMWLERSCNFKSDLSNAHNMWGLQTVCYSLMLFIHIWIHPFNLLYH